MPSEKTVPAGSLSGIRLVQSRWVLVLASSYLVWFNRANAGATSLAAAYVVVYLASAPLLHAWWLRSRRRASAEFRIVLFDLTMVALGLVLAGPGVTDFYPIFFFALFLAAVALSLRAAVAAALLLGTIHLARLATTNPEPLWLHPEHLLRLPFLLAAALFFGLVSRQQRLHLKRLRSEKKRRALLRTLAAAAHDLRSPLTNIASFLELLLDGDAGELNAEQRELVERAHGDVWRVLHRANNLLDAARLESGLAALQREPRDLLSVLRSTVAELASVARSRGVELEIACEATTTWAALDAFQLGRVFANILDNAIKHSPRGERVRIRVWNPDPHSVGVEVCDRGPGISPEHRERLFKPYRGSRRGPTSSGLGLYIARALTEAHGGTITVQAAASGGTCVSVVLPTVPAPR